MSTTSHNNDSMMSRNQHYGVAIGLLIGVLIQLSSLCSNSSDFLVPWPSRRSEDDRDDDLDDLQHDRSLAFQHMRLWKMAWSTGTTVMGIVLLMTLRILVVAVQKTFMAHVLNEESTTTTSSSSLCESMRRMEQSVATGTLWGVSMAWILTDYTLGFAVPHSTMPYRCVPVLTTSIALLAWHLVLHWVTTANDDNIDECDLDETQMDDVSSHVLTQQQLRTPLLPKDDIDIDDIEMDDDDDDDDTIPIPTTCIAIDTPSSRRRIVPLLSFGMGTIIGIFVQCCTLGVLCLEQFASFSRSTVVQIVSSNAIVDDTTEIDPSSAIAILQWNDGMAIAASFVMSCIGLLLLLCIRTFMMGVISMTLQQQHRDPVAPTSSSTCIRDDIATKENLTATTLSASSSILVIPSRPEEDGDPHNIATFVLTHVEVYMAMGTAVGLNLAWMVTDMMIRRSLPSLDQPHNYWYQSIITLVVSTLWCPAVVVCTRYFYSSGGGRTPRDDPNRHDTLSLAVIDNDDGDRYDHYDHPNEPNDERPCHSTTRVPVPCPGNDVTDEEMAYM